MVDSSDGVPDSTEVPTIKDLVLAARDRGMTYRKMDEASGGRVNYQTFQKLGTGEQPKAFPEMDTIKGLAEALQVTETTIVLAIAKSLGVTIDTESGFAMQLPRGIDQLDEEMQRAILAVARAAVRRLNGVADQPEHRAPPGWRESPYTGAQDPGMGGDEQRDQRRQF